MFFFVRISGLVVLGGVEGEFAGDLSGAGAADRDVSVMDEHQDVSTERLITCADRAGFVFTFVGSFGVSTGSRSPTARPSGAPTREGSVQGIGAVGGELSTA